MKGKLILKTMKELKLSIAIGKVAVAAFLAIVATSLSPAIAQTQNKSAPSSNATLSNDLKIVDFAPHDADAIVVKGCVVGKDDEPLSGASIFVLDKYNNLILQGIATEGFDSQFAIRVSKGTKVKIQYVGYKTLTKEFDVPEDNLVIKMETEEKTETTGKFWLLSSTSK